MVKGGEVALPSQAVEQHRDKGVERRSLEMRIGKSKGSVKGKFWN